MEHGGKIVVECIENSEYIANRIIKCRFKLPGLYYNAEQMKEMWCQL